MKNLFYICTIVLNILFLNVYSVVAQPWAEVSSTVTPNFYRMKTSGDDVLKAVKTQKGKGFKAFKRWEKYWDQRVFPDGSFPPANLVQKNWELYQAEKSLSALIPGSSWTSLGPNSSSGGYAGIGRINRLTFHPSNSSIIFACTAGGGLWKTTNGGTSWVPLTDNLASIGTSGLVINPADPNIMYLATGDGDGSDTYSYGVLKSTNGGLTWNTTGLTFTTGTVIYKLQQHATDPNILLAGTNGGLYRTANGGTSWTKVVASGQFYDIEALSATNLVAVTKGGFYRSTDGGATWVLATTIASTGRIALAVSASNPDFVGALVSNTSNGFKGFYASVDGGLTYTLRSSTPNLMGWETNGSDSGGQAWYDLCMAVSPTDVNQIIVGGVNTWKSINGGVSWSIMTNWYQTSTVPAMHADQHDLIFLNSTTIYAANDGGIYRSTNNGVSWTDLTNGMSISQLYRASAAQTDTRIIAGLQDNGTKLRSTTGTWSDEIGGDGMDCAIDPTNASFMYGTLYYGDIQRSTNGGSSWTSITPSTGTDGDWVSPVLLDPVNPSTIYLGYRDLMKSTDRGTTWSAISAGQTGGNFISNIAVAPSDPLVIYISWGTSMAKTVNGGTSWATINAPISSQISSLLVDPTNPNNLYATYSNFTAGSKVYVSNNGGTSWTNISGTLPNIPANKIIYQTGSNGALYLGMDVGIYYRDNTQTDWSLYNSGLPNVEIFDLEIRYSDKKLIAATYGRGLWESPLYVGTPLSVPAVSSFSPTSATRGNTVTITGSNFNGISSVSFGGTAATSFAVVSPTSITAIVGNGNSGNVSVTNSAGTGTLSGFTYINTTPTITSFTPTSGKTGQVVNITGTNFTGATTVSFGGTAATTFTVVSATSINATVGAGASGTVSVTSASGTGTLAGFTYLPPPTITSFSPTSAGTGQTVTITGTNFTGASAISFGGTAATSFTVVSATSITAVVGAGATGSVSLTTSNGIASRTGFTFTSATPAPAITSFTPTSGKTGQVVNITGTNFTGATAVSFGGTAATTFTVVSATGINATVGAGASGTVSVTTASGTGTLAGFTYLPPPTITSFSPTSAGTGQTVTITGTNFTGTTGVNFGGTAAASFTVVSATSITAVVGAGTTGNVSVNTANGNVNRGGFTFITAITVPPTITSFSPTKAIPGSNITLTGTGFNPTLSQNTVWIGASKATISAATTTSITARVPVGATTDYIRILNSGTQQGVQSNQFFVSSYSPSKDSIQSAEIAPKVDLTTLGGPEDIRVSDLDGDGIPDLVIANHTAGSISVFRNTSGIGNINVANFVRKDFTSGTGATFISVADLDNDGKQDIIVANQGENTLSIFKNISTSGNISFNSPVKIATPSTPIGLGIGDFDKNGWLDIATANHGNATVSIFTNKGIFNSISTNNFNPRFGLITGLNPITIDVADMDGDSKSDIVVGNYGSNSISIFKNNYISGALATASFSTKLDFNAGNKPGYVKLGDMDGDSKLDIVVLAEGVNSVGILRNTSTSGVLNLTSFASRVNFNTGITPYYISVGDLTGNGKLDILVTNFGDGTATVWQNKATPGSITSASFFKRLNFTVGTKPYAGLLADIDGDAKTDILVSNTGSNTLSILRNVVGSQMIVSPTSSTLPATGGSVTATVSSNLSWKVTSNASWLIPIAISGKNNGTIRVNFIANTGALRKGVVTFTADGIVKTMEITQAARVGMVNPANELNGEFSEKPEVNAKEITHIDWELFPNPSDGIINLSVKFSNLVETGVLSIRDINGRVVKSVTNVRTGTYQIDLSSEPKSTYLFSLQDEEGKGLFIKQIILN